MYVYFPLIAMLQLKLLKWHKTNQSVENTGMAFVKGMDVKN